MRIFAKLWCLDDDWCARKYPANWNGHRSCNHRSTCSCASACPRCCCYRCWARLILPWEVLSNSNRRDLLWRMISDVAVTCEWIEQPSTMDAPQSWSLTVLGRWHRAAEGSERTWLRFAHLHKAIRGICPLHEPYFLFMFLCDIGCLLWAGGHWKYKKQEITLTQSTCAFNNLTHLPEGGDMTSGVHDLLRRGAHHVFGGEP